MCSEKRIIFALIRYYNGSTLINVIGVFPCEVNRFFPVDVWKVFLPTIKLYDGRSHIYLNKLKKKKKEMNDIYYFLHIADIRQINK